ncbi:patatin-like phospholipase family protein [Hymenobacter lapidiphilus]|uniref:Patatin-like phospholipase family protein n=1 Tax=Hymenobacter lapidiphilus TaxID=2608003 RepID=A0A7Y7U7E8_9BACT|nr:patatin-like phospholipase family protein [Hymenobacter lapidiphilus]NVO33342.1 patatin-like phospholipase family protein [Hymenobacter lapidiphilus]
MMRLNLQILLLLLPLLSAGSPAARAQAPARPTVYRNLVMEGGGIRGIAYGGALAELEQQGRLTELRRVGGTSAGAIQAALLAVGYAPAEIISIVNELPIQRLNDGQYIFFGGGRRLLKQYGWYRGDAFTELLAGLVGRQTQRPNLTLGELHALAQQQPTRYRDLYTTGTNLTRQCRQVFSYETHPNLRVADAVRISMSIPLYFRAVLLDAATGQVVAQPAKGQAVEVLVDGGLLANYPLDLFDQPRYLTTAPAGPGAAARPDSATFRNPETLGLRLDRPEQVAVDTQPGGRARLAPYAIQDLGSYIGALYTVALENLNPTYASDWPRTVSISTVGFNPKIKRLSAEQKQQLMDSGRNGVQEFLGRGN